MASLIWLWFITIAGLVFFIMLMIEMVKGIEETQQMKKRWTPKIMTFDDSLSWWEVHWMLICMMHSQKKRH